MGRRASRGADDGDARWSSSRRRLGICIRPPSVADLHPFAGGKHRSALSGDPLRGPYVDPQCVTEQSQDPVTMAPLRHAHGTGAYALLFVIALVPGIHFIQHAEADELGARPDPAEQALASVATAYQSDPGDTDAERALVTREKRISRSAARLRARPAAVQPQTVIEPITWVSPMSRYRITGEFGDRSYMWSSGKHTGLDFAAPTGTPIRSIAAGVVKEASYAGSYGYRTIVTLPDGGEVWYCHQERLAVTAGQTLKVGQLLGFVGASGNVTGAHLHLEVRYGDTPVDPAEVFAREGVHV